MEHKLTWCHDSLPIPGDDWVPDGEEGDVADEPLPAVAPHPPVADATGPSLSPPRGDDFEGAGLQAARDRRPWPRPRAGRGRIASAIRVRALLQKILCRRSRPRSAASSPPSSTRPASSPSRRTSRRRRRACFPPAFQRRCSGGRRRGTRPPVRSCGCAPQPSFQPMSSPARNGDNAAPRPREPAPARASSRGAA